MSLPDAAEAGSRPASHAVEPLRPILEPEEVKTTAAPPRSVSQAPRPPHPSILPREEAGPPRDFEKALAKLQQQRQTGAPAPLPPTDPAQALAQLQRQREIGAPAPPPPPSKPSALAGGSPETQRLGGEPPRPLASAAPGLGIKDSHDVPTAAALAMEVQNRGLTTEMLGSPPLPVAPVAPVVPSTKSITSPLGALNLKPGTSPLAPSRTPAPIAIVGGSSLKIHSPDKAISPSRPPSTLLAAIDANAPKTPTKDSSFVPPPVPAPSSSAKSLAPAVPPAAPSSRPNTAPKSFPPPAGGPPASYERAFRQWSSPNITTGDDSSAGDAGPVTFQVYTAQDISAGRAPMRSMVAVPREPKKASLAARIGMAAVGTVIVLLTAAAVIAVSTDDPKPPTPATSAKALPSMAPSVPSGADPAPAPTGIAIGDPIDPIDPVDSVDELPPTPPPTPAPITTAAAPAPKPKPKPTTTPAPPASLKSIAPPPNPYGK